MGKHSKTNSTRVSISMITARASSGLTAATQTNVASSCQNAQLPRNATSGLLNATSSERLLNATSGLLNATSVLLWRLLLTRSVLLWTLLLTRSVLLWTLLLTRLALLWTLLLTRSALLRMSLNATSGLLNASCAGAPAATCRAGDHWNVLCRCPCVSQSVTQSGVYYSLTI